MDFVGKPLPTLSCYPICVGHSGVFGCVPPLIRHPLTLELAASMCTHAPRLPVAMTLDSGAPWGLLREGPLGFLSAPTLLQGQVLQDAWGQQGPLRVPGLCLVGPPRNGR